jgi:hypothetical protein
VSGVLPPFSGGPHCGGMASFIACWRDGAAYVPGLVEQRNEYHGQERGRAGLV